MHQFASMLHSQLQSSYSRWQLFQCWKSIVELKLSILLNEKHQRGSGVSLTLIRGATQFDCLWYWRATIDQSTAYNSETLRLFNVGTIIAEPAVDYRLHVLYRVPFNFQVLWAV